MTTPAAPDPAPAIQFDVLISALADRTRWRVLDELLKSGEALPTSELARRLGANANTLSKHVSVLRDSGIIEVGWGRVNRIPPAFLVPDQPRSLDLGVVLLRLDQMPSR